MGGSAQNTLLTCIGLSKKGYDVILAHGLSLESHMTDTEEKSVTDLIEKAKKHGTRVISIPSLVRRIDPFKDIRAFFSLWRVLAEEKPTIVHAHTSKAGLLGRWAAKMAKTPIIVYTPHGHVFYGHFGSLASKVFLFLEKLGATITDHVIALTKGEEKDYISLSMYSPQNLTTIHSGVNIEQYMTSNTNGFDKKNSLGLNPQDPIVGTVGWLTPVKGPVHLFNAMIHVWEAFPKIQLLYVGKGPLIEDLKELVLNSGVSEKVKFLGWRSDVQEIIPIIDLFVLPSLNEGMGRVLVEAMASKRPIVASRVGGIIDLIKNGYNGLLVSPGDEQELAEAIIELMNNPERAKEMGKKGEILSRHFTVDNMIKKIDKLYSDLIKTRSCVHR